MVSVFDQTELRLPKPNYDYVTNEDDARKAMSFLANHPIHSIDTETTALDMYEAKISLIQIGVNGKVFVFDVRHETEHSSLHKDVLKPILTSNNHTRILQNASFDMKMIYRHMGFYLSNIYDTMLVEQLLNLGLPGVKVNLPALLLRYLGITMQKESRLTFQDYNQKFQNFQLEYAANDVVALETIKDLQWSKVQQEGLENVCRLEFEFLVPMAEMEGNGILLDVDRWSSIMVEVKKEMIETGNAVKSILEENQDQSTLFGVSTINIDSNLQLKKALNRYGLNMDNTSVDTLKKHKGVPVIDALLDYRGAQKLISTYSDTLIEKVNPHTGRLHTDFKQLVATGRMSSARPNLQNIPKKQKFRSCFVAKEGYSLITSDMSGAELRILGNLSKDPVFLDCFKNNIDLHTRTASEIFDVHIDEVTHDMRNIAKNINFGLCVLEDTKVITDKGIKEIKNVNIGEKISHDLGVNEIIDKKFMGEKEVFEIKTKYGYTIEATEDHLIKVIDKNGNYTDKKLSDIDIDKDYTCIKLGSDLFPKNNYRFNKFNVKKKANYKHFILPSVLDENWATFLGLYVSEGHLHKSKNGNYDSIQFGISPKEKDFVNVFDNLLSKLFDKFGRYEKKEIITYSINSVLIANWIKSLFTCDFKNKTSNIEVPECIKHSPKEIQIAFISALFEGDGTIFHSGNHYCIGYSSMSINLMTDLQVMLLNFGILSALYFGPDKRYPDRDYYTLYIIGEYKDLFMEVIGFLTEYKNNKKIDNRSYIRSCFTLPYQKYRLLKVRNKLKTIEHKTVKDWNNIRYLYNAANLTSIKGLGNFYLDQFAKYDKFFKFIYDNNIVPLPIKSIKSKGIKKVYDISVDEHQYFLANGFIVHNCYGISPVGLARSLKIPKKKAEKMIDKYFKRYSGVEKYLEKAGKDAILNRYTITASGRKRYYNLPEYDHPDRKKIQRSIERRGKNASIQGSLVFDTNIKGLGSIGKYVGKKVELETGFGRNTAVGVYSGEKDVYELKLSNGAKLNITLEHQIPVCTNNNMVDKRVEDIVLDNDMLIIPLNVENGKETDKAGDHSLVPDFIPKTIEKVFRCNPEVYNNLSFNEKAHLRRFKLGECSYTSWRKFYNFMPDGEDKKYLSQFLSYDFCKAISLKNIGKKKTYDLICEKGPKYFIANGVIVHNSNADAIKESMVLLVDRLVKGGYDAKLLLTVHDEVVVEVKEDQKYEVSKIIPQCLIDGFGRYFSLIPMEADSLIGPCWLKNSCENKINGIECGNMEMKFIPDDRHGTKLICNKCGAGQE